MLDIDIKPRTDNKIDIYVTDGGNHEPLINSSQGYENHAAAVHLVERLFGPDARDEKLDGVRQALVHTLDTGASREELIDQIRRILDTGETPEPVQLTIHWRNGTTDTRQLR